MLQSQNIFIILKKKFYSHECIHLLETLLKTFLNTSCLLAQAVVWCFVRRYPLQPL